MNRVGRVVERGSGSISVCFERPEACEHCGQCTGQKEHTLVTVRGDAPLGSMVEVAMPEGRVLGASVLAYVLPLLLLLAGIGLGSLFSDREWVCALTGLAAMGCAWFVLRTVEKRMRKKNVGQPELVAVRSEGELSNGNQTDQG